MARFLSFFSLLLMSSVGSAAVVPKFDFMNFVVEQATYEFSKEVRKQLDQLLGAEFRFLADLASYEMNTRGDLVALQTEIETSVLADLSLTNAIASNTPPADSCRMYTVTRSMQESAAVKPEYKETPFQTYSANTIQVLGGGQGAPSQADLDELEKGKIELFESMMETFRNPPDSNGAGGMNVDAMSEFMDRAYSTEALGQMSWIKTLLAGGDSLIGREIDVVRWQDNRDIESVKLMREVAIASLSEWMIERVVAGKIKSSGIDISGETVANAVGVPQNSAVVQEVLALEGAKPGAKLTEELLVSLAMRTPFTTFGETAGERLKEDHTTDIRRDLYLSAVSAYREEQELYNDVAKLAAAAVALGDRVERLTN